MAEKALLGFGPEAVSPLIASLAHPDVHIQEASARILGKIKDPSAVFPLIAAFQAPFADRVRIAAAVALGDLGDARAVAPLMEALYEKTSPALHEVPRALAKLGACAVSPLIQALGDADGQVSRMAMAALGEIGDARAIPPLIGRLKSDAPFMSRAAADALVEIGEASVLPLMSVASEKGKARQRALDTLIRIGADGVAPLLEGLQSDPARYEAVALAVLPEIGTPAAEAVAALWKAPDSSGNDLWGRLLLAMGPPAVPFLVEALKGRDLHLALQGARILGKMGDERGVAPLMEALASDEPVLQAVSAKALADMGEPAVSALVSVLADPEFSAQGMVRAVLKEMGAPAAEPLIRVLNSDDALLVKRAAAILVEMESAAVPALIRHLSDPDLAVQRHCAEILVEIGAPAVSYVTEIVDRADPGRLWLAVKILGEMGDPRAVEALTAVSDHPDPKVRYFVVEALGRLRDPAAIPVLVAALKDPRMKFHAAAALAGLGWRPKTPSERLYFTSASKDGGISASQKAAFRARLWSDLEKKPFPEKACAFHALLNLFGEPVASELARFLERQGSLKMARLFIESGLGPLVESGLDWLARNIPQAFYDDPEAWLRPLAP